MPITCTITTFTGLQQILANTSVPNTAPPPRTLSIFSYSDLKHVSAHSLMLRYNSRNHISRLGVTLLPTQKTIDFATYLK